MPIRGVEVVYRREGIPFRARLPETLASELLRHIGHDAGDVLHNVAVAVDDPLQVRRRHTRPPCGLRCRPSPLRRRRSGTSRGIVRRAASIGKFGGILGAGAWRVRRPARTAFAARNPHPPLLRRPLPLSGEAEGGAKRRVHSPLRENEGTLGNLAGRGATARRLVEAARIELATSCSQSRRASAALRPDASPLVYNAASCLPTQDSAALTASAGIQAARSAAPLLRKRLVIPAKAGTYWADPRSGNPPPKTPPN